MGSAGKDARKKKQEMPVARPNVKNPEERGGFPEHAAEASGKDLVVSIRW